MKSQSITQKRLSDFLKSAKEREQLNWESIQGLSFIKLKKGGAWRLRYTDVTGKRRTATICDHNTPPAKAAELAQEWRLKLGQGIDPLNQKQQLAKVAREQQQRDAAKIYLNTGRYFNEIYTPYKLNNFRQGKDTLAVIARNFSFLFSLDMDQIKPLDILSWYNKKRAKGIMRTTLVRDYGAFKAMLKHATRTDNIQTKPVLDLSPLDKFTLPQLTISEQEALEAHTERLEAKRDIMSEADKGAILKGLDLFAEFIRQQRRASRSHGKPYLPDLDQVTYPHWFIPFCKIAQHTGMRPIDIYSLKWENLIYNQFNQQTTLHFTPSKTKKAEKNIKVKFPITGELLDVFSFWHKQNGKVERGYIFKSERTGRQLERKSHLTHWKKVKQLGGVSPFFDFYSFRHNFISQLVAKGAPIEKIAGLVGHKDSSMIFANYLKHDESDAASILELINNDWITAQVTNKQKGVV